MTKVTETIDTLNGGKCNMRVIFVDNPEGMGQTIVVRPYSGTVDIRTNGREGNIDAYAIPALIRALRIAKADAER